VARTRMVREEARIRDPDQRDVVVSVRPDRQEICMVRRSSPPLHSHLMTAACVRSEDVRTCQHEPGRDKEPGGAPPLVVDLDGAVSQQTLEWIVHGPITPLDPGR
jgi:hypothetical protein